MSWLNRINNVQLKVITGDGKEYFPLWKDAERNISFNTETFNFVNVNGAYIERKTLSGREFPINFYFVGENCIDESAAFLESAIDPRPWKITHPLYDTLLCQPITLSENNTEYNVSVITGTLFETIENKFPVSTVNAEQTLSDFKTSIDESITSNISDIQIEDVSNVQESVTLLSENYTELATTDEEIQTLTDLTRAAAGAAQNASTDTATYINSVKNLINFPLQSTQSVEFSIKKMAESIISLFDLFSTKPDIFQANANMLLTTACQISNTEYTYRSEITNVLNLLTDSYNYILTSLDTMEYNMYPDTGIGLDLIVNFAIENLFEISFNSKQERTKLLTKDENLISLVHDLYGFSDENLQFFIDTNDISLNEYLLIEKGRKIYYYV